MLSAHKLFFIFLIFFSSVIRCNLSSTGNEEVYKGYIDLARKKFSSFENFQFNEKLQLSNYWKKNPSRYSGLPALEKWKTVQMTFQLDKNTFLNHSKESIHLTPKSKVSWEVDKGEYNLTFDFGILKEFFISEPGGTIRIFQDNELNQEIFIHSKNLETWSKETIPLKISKSFSIEWISENGIHLFIGNPILKKTQVVREKKYNVILFIIDSLRIDSVGCYKDGWKVTPNIDALCKDGVKFTKHFANANWTKPSMISMLYGEYAPNLGIINDGFKVHLYEKNIFYNHKNRGLVNILRDNGYYTSSIMNNVFFLDYTTVGVDPGFHELIQIGKDEIDTEEITKHAIQTIQEHKEEPFFLHVNYNTPHVPYLPPKKYNEEVKKMIGEKANKTHSMIINYLGEVRYADDEIGKIIEKLKNEGIYDETFIIISSDHGELFSENHTIEFNKVSGTRWGHGQTLFEEEIAVPLVIKPPKEIMNKVLKTEVVSQSSGISLAPTLLGFMGIKSHSMRGKDYSEYFIYENEVLEEEIYTSGRMMESIRKDNKKFIRLFPGYTNLTLGGTIPEEKLRVQVYDLIKDIEEKNNIFESEKKEFNELFSKNRTDRSSFVLNFPEGSKEIDGNYYFPGEIYNVNVEGNLEYTIFTRFAIKFKKLDRKKARLVVSTITPEIGFNLSLFNKGNTMQYKIGKWGIPYSNELAKEEDILISTKPPEFLDKINSIWLYNDGLTLRGDKISGSFEMGEEVKDILKSWGYIHE